MKKIPSQPMMIIIRGPIGSGKSTVANILRKHFPNSSLVDYDVFKRMIDHTKSTPWRQRMAFQTSLYLCEEIIKKKRTVILDIHSAKKYQYAGLKQLAGKYRFPVQSVLLRPPLETCFQFVSKRHIPDIKYQIAKTKIIEYWRKLYRVPGEPVFDSSQMTAQKIANQILKILKT